ncbi:hypothetical protein GWI33_007050 [Rhynchophorus ferrugineus]|uniref:Uncharacterized protein n=1 Tax=Rhynchophorus ferrugineus TaxID=354439 RepID=A0A834II09_RHYFE|nr:hypothetical protein GWI33_007050 [Rhynchophorus ferrugineus]
MCCLLFVIALFNAQVVSQFIYILLSKLFKTFRIVHQLSDRLSYGFASTVDTNIERETRRAAFQRRSGPVAAAAAAKLEWQSIDLAKLVGQGDKQSPRLILLNLLAIQCYKTGLCFAL